MENISITASTFRISVEFLYSLLSVRLEIIPIIPAAIKLIPTSKAKNGNYKISPEGNPVYFLLYCAAIPVGIVVSAGMAYEMLRKKSVKQNIGTAEEIQGHQADRRESDL